MSLPRRPERSQPIPQEPFSSPDVTLLQGPYWDIAVGEGLEVDAQGSLQLTGSEPSVPSAYLYGTNGFVSLGARLEIGPDGYLKASSSPYIYCTPQFSYLPVTYPPYNCETEVNTAGVTSFGWAWTECQDIVEFPCVDSSSVTNFEGAWSYCYYMENFPVLNTSQGTDFSYSWGYNYMLGGQFPKLNFSKAQRFGYTWTYCGYNAPEPISFPTGFFDSCTQNCLYLGGSFHYCNLSQQSVDNIITSLDNTGTSAGYLNTSYCGSMPSQSVIDNNVTALWDKGWIVFLDDYTPGIPEPSYSCSTSVDTSGVESLYYAWSGCSLSSFPSLNTSSCKFFAGTWQNNSFTTFPSLDVSHGINFSYAWWNCTQLTSFPTLDTSQGLNFEGAWGNCTQLTSFPPVDVSKSLVFQQAWFNCASLTSFPTLDTSQGLNFEGAWNGCSSLTSFPTLDVSSGTNFSFTWFGCSSLTPFPLLDVSSGTNFSLSWQGCSSLTSFPPIDLSSGNNFEGAWQNCTSLTTFPAGVFDTCLATSFSNAWVNCALSQQSVDNILVSLDTAGQPNGTVGLNGGTSAAPGAAGLAAKTSLQGKGWTMLTN